MAEDELNTAQLDKFVASLKKAPYARVGVLGQSAGRDNGKTNATVGAAHEFGTSTLPMRSFLRVPISDNLSNTLQKTGTFKKETIREVISSGSVIPWLQIIAIRAEAIVLEGFATGGFGKWAPLKSATMKRKKIKQILVETQQLLRSITWDVKE